MNEKGRCRYLLLAANNVCTFPLKKPAIYPMFLSFCPLIPFGYAPANEKLYHALMVLVAAGSIKRWPLIKPLLHITLPIASPLRYIIPFAFTASPRQVA